MPKLDIHRIGYKKSNTCTIVIAGASLELENCDILQKDETDYGYQKAVVKLSPEKAFEMKRLRKR